MVASISSNYRVVGGTKQRVGTISKEGTEKSLGSLKEAVNVDGTRRREMESKTVKFSAGQSVFGQQGSKSSRSKDSMSFLDALKTLREEDEVSDEGDEDNSSLNLLDSPNSSAQAMSLWSGKVCAQLDTLISEEVVGNGGTGAVMKNGSDYVVKWGIHDVSSSDSGCSYVDKEGEYATFYTERDYNSDAFDSSSGCDNTLLEDVRISGGDTLDLRHHVSIGGTTSQSESRFRSRHTVIDIAPKVGGIDAEGEPKDISDVHGADRTRVFDDVKVTGSLITETISDIVVSERDNAFEISSPGDLTYQVDPQWHCSSSSDYYIDSSDVEMNHGADMTSDSDLLADVTVDERDDDSIYL